jgi:hypothetical protein
VEEFATAPPAAVSPKVNVLAVLAAPGNKNGLVMLITGVVVPVATEI